MAERERAGLEGTGRGTTTTTTTAATMAMVSGAGGTREKREERLLVMPREVIACENERGGERKR